MQIQMYQDLDMIKPGGIARLGKKTILLAGGILLIAVPMILALVYICKVDVRIASQIGAVIIVPVAWIGLYNKKGLTYNEYQKVKSNMNRRLFYVPEVESEVMEDVQRTGKADRRTAKGK